MPKKVEVLLIVCFIAASLIAVHAAGVVTINIFSDETCQSLTTSFTLQNDASVCQSLGQSVYGKGSCANGQATITAYNDSSCTSGATPLSIVREGVCGDNIFGGLADRPTTNAQKNPQRHASSLHQ